MLLPYFEMAESTALGEFIRTSLWLFPAIECVHLMGLVLMGGAVLLVDLKLLGVGLRDFPMPVYDGDIEKSQGLPQSAKAFKTLLIEHHGVLLSTPEYNSHYPAVLKNSIDWASRKEADETPLMAFKGKVAGVMSASPGALAALRSQTLVRSLLLYLGMLVVPTQTLPAGMYFLQLVSADGQQSRKLLKI